MSTHIIYLHSPISTKWNNCQNNAPPKGNSVEIQLPVQQHTPSLPSTMDPLYITIETVKTAAKYVVGKLFDAIGEAVYAFIMALMEQEEIAEP